VSTTIRGVRVNLAAAICWESYMPLLRQTLYAQNINLYLAPTADGRDGWLSLMRTVGVEGRCFVVSSNMCVPATEPAAGQADGTATGARVPSLPRGSSSVISEEEGSSFDRPLTSKRSRRKSVFDEDGNEIVLCCPADNDDKTTGSAAAAVDGIAPPSTSAAGGVNGKQPPSSWVSRGGSCIVNPFGDVLAGPQWEDPNGLIYADVDLRDCIKGRLDFDAAGHYSRNDSFNFSVKGLDLEPLPY
jgi:nitrilase